MRLIDADALKYTMLYKENWLKGAGIEAPAIWKQDIDDAPTIDAVPVVRCGDCKYKDDGIDEDGYPFLKCLNGRSYGGTRINDYCSWGERKDGDGDE